MLATTTLEARHAQLIAEREQHQIRHIVAERQAELRIAALAAQLKAARKARADAEAAWAKNDQAYGALIGDYAKLIADAKADDAADASEPAADAELPYLGHAGEFADETQWQQLLDEAAND